MKLRHEVKHVITYLDMLTIRHRLSAIAKHDAHVKERHYKIRSLYFDNIQDKALREKLDGVKNREKFRIRYYNDDTSFIRLEKKSKYGNLGSKMSAPLLPQEVQDIIEGKIEWMKESPAPLIRELYEKMVTQGLKPKTIVDYTREPFIYEPGNVRVTLDYDIRTGLTGLDFLNPNCVTIPAKDSGIILEVKWDEFLPEIIKQAVGITNRNASAFSKYATCRMYE